MPIKQQKLDTNNHSVFKLHYHLIICTKYRTKVITNEISTELKQYFEQYAPDHDITLEEWGHENDHVHILFKAHPQTNLAKFINAYKSASSRNTRKKHPEIEQKLSGGAFWSRSYCLLTTGGAPLEIIKKYIQSQGKDN